jgi:sporulation protein YlmC with PRC-barrel domain
MYCVFLGRATATNAPSAGSVGTSQLADNAVTSAKITYPLTTFSSTGIDDNATSTAITIDSSENVGIGISNPTYPLQVYKATSGNIVRLGSVRTLDISNSDNGSYVGAIWDRDINSAGGIHTFSIEGNEKIRILPTGGITFNGDTAAANGLDDYEEGTWTPSLDSISSSNASGDYTKIGNVCTAKFKISSDGSGSNINITGFPFTSDSGFEQQGLARETQTGGDLYFIRVAASATTGTLIRYDANNSIGSSDTFEGQITYITNT